MFFQKFRSVSNLSIIRFRSTKAPTYLLQSTSSTTRQTRILPWLKVLARVRMSLAWPRGSRLFFIHHLISFQRPTTWDLQGSLGNWEAGLPRGQSHSPDEWTNNLNYVCTYSVPAFHHSTTLISTFLPRPLLDQVSDHHYLRIWVYWLKKHVASFLNQS